MSDKINIDELLKQELGNLSPEPPAGAWEGISNQVQQLQTATNVAAGTAVKSTLLTTKLIIAAGVVVTGVAVFIGYKTGDNKSTGQKAGRQRESVIIQEKKKDVITVDVPVTEKEPVISSGVNNDFNKEHTLPTKGAVKSKARKTEAAADVPVNTAKTSDDQGIINTENKPEPTLTPAQPVKQENPNQPKVHNEDPVSYDNGNQQDISEEQVEHPEIFNVVTPNNDNKNDEFVITIYNEIIYDLKIVDRNGNIVFESKDKNQHWKGFNMFNGKQCDDGSYIMTFRYQVKGMKEPVLINDLIQLKRN